MITKKICMLGTFSVGKTSLVQRFVHSIFSEKYLSTIGVTISKKELDVGKNTILFMLWDIAGKDTYTTINPSHLRGSSGFFIVADGTRAETLPMAVEIRDEAFRHTGPIPSVFLVNKTDLTDQWEVTENALADFREQGNPVLTTSAKTASGVEEAFRTLGLLMCPE